MAAARGAGAGAPVAAGRLTRGGCGAASSGRLSQPAAALLLRVATAAPLPGAWMATGPARLAQRPLAPRRGRAKDTRIEFTTRAKPEDTHYIRDTTVIVILACSYIRGVRTRV